MVSSKRSTLSLGFQRALSYIAAVVVGFYLQVPFYPFLLGTLSYREPSSVLGAFHGVSTGIHALLLSYAFLFSTISNFFGKKGDYIFLFIYLGLALLLFFDSINSVIVMFLGLTGVAAFGSALGYMLKTGKQNWFPKR